MSGCASGRLPRVRTTYDPEANAAYVYLVESVKPGEVAYSRHANIALDRAAITVDFDEDGRVLGIELLGADRLLRAESIEAAQDITRPA
jgi:uncharacterized protein YuzE